MKTFFSIMPGAKILFNKEEWEISAVYDTNFVAAKNCNTKETRRLHVSELKPLEEIKSQGISAPACTIDDNCWKEALLKYNYIRPLLALGLERKKSDVEEVAQQAGVKADTIYRWIRKFTVTGQVSSLVRSNRSDLGVGRLSPEVEALVEATINELYLTDQRRSETSICEAVRSRCKKAHLKIPHANTIRNRLAMITNDIKLSKRYGSKVAQEKLSPIKSSFPGADYPLSVVQTDHTKMNIIVVDEIYRRPLGRPWITVAFDVYSRMVCGFYISLSTPGTLGTALCISHAILPKDYWLAQRNIANDWPVWGIPQCIHMDNGKEFHGNALRRACEEYDIRIEWRPVATPHWGGHIERMMGTLSTALHELPGTTFSNPKERGNYDSEAKAVLTLHELEKWVSEYITGVYHKRIHSEIGMPPEKRWEMGILGDDNRPGIGLPERPTDANRILLDFLPIEKRSIQRYGVVVERIHYYADVLRPYIDDHDQKSRKARLFTFRYDPRDMSKLFFLDPDINEYFEIPYRDLSRPPISIWEIREARKHALEIGLTALDEDAIFAAHERLLEIEKTAKKLSLKTRRSIHRLLDKTQRPETHPKARADLLTFDDTLDIAAKTTPETTIEAFDDIEVEVE